MVEVTDFGTEVTGFAGEVTDFSTEVTDFRNGATKTTKTKNTHPIKTNRNQ